MKPLLLKLNLLPQTRLEMLTSISLITLSMLLKMSLKALSTKLKILNVKLKPEVVLKDWNKKPTTNNKHSMASSKISLIQHNKHWMMLIMP
jgi:hypothetical protein